MLPGKDINKHNEKIDKIVSNRNGKVLEYYKNSKTKLKLVCLDGHEFEIKPHKLYGGGWCSKCTNSISEEFTRFIFENIFNDKFDKVRVKYDGHTIELDGFNEKLKIAFEYNGVQHYKLNKFIKTEEQLKHQQYLDNLKINYCDENNIKLVVIPYNIKHSDILEFIKKELIVNSYVSIDYNDFSNNYSYTKNRREELEYYATEKDGKILEFGSNFVKLECKRGHIWNSDTWTLKKGHWCRECYLIDGSVTNINKPMLSYDELKSRAKYLNIQLTTTKLEYDESVKCELFLSFICKNEHIFRISKYDFLIRYISIYNKEKCGRLICQECLSKRQNSFIENLSKFKIDIIDISNYLCRKTVTYWKFSCGHIDYDKAKNIIERVKRGNTECKECLNKK